MGPATEVRDTPLDEVPAYLRAGGVLVLGAPDVDTLVATDDPEVIDAADRAAIRRVLAFGDAPGTSAAADPRVTIARDAGATTVGADGGGGVEAILWELRLPDADGARADADGLVEAAGPGAVTAGCRCWAFDGEARVLWVGTGGDASFSVR